MSKPKHEPDDIVKARRRKGYADVESPQHGLICEGDVIPMRFEEASARADFEIVEDEPEPAQPEPAPVSEPTKEGK